MMFRSFPPNWRFPAGPVAVDRDGRHIAQGEAGYLEVTFVLLFLNKTCKLFALWALNKSLTKIGQRTGCPCEDMFFA
ncbi:unnamed protein product [Gongylonema pulchrum]|uniref:Uncharacterized protein n=1 Tax=Gongylonema pulchrum TaxID=637853 RepID=A0A183CUW4_9BILA|nr:unnamed protein product [Gongylonema pulchrum]